MPAYMTIKVSVLRVASDALELLEQATKRSRSILKMEGRTVELGYYNMPNFVPREPLSAPIHASDLAESYGTTPCCRSTLIKPAWSNPRDGLKSPTPAEEAERWHPPSPLVLDCSTANWVRIAPHTSAESPRRDACKPTIFGVGIYKLGCGAIQL